LDELECGSAHPLLRPRLRLLDEQRLRGRGQDVEAIQHPGHDCGAVPRVQLGCAGEQHRPGGWVLRNYPAGGPTPQRREDFAPGYNGFLRICWLPVGIVPVVVTEDDRDGLVGEPVGGNLPVDRVVGGEKRSGKQIELVIADDPRVGDPAYELRDALAPSPIGQQQGRGSSRARGLGLMVLAQQRERFV
jgi:hypothetical protein